MDINKLFSVKDKVVVITGGSRGIGLMIAQGFVANGAKVYISSRKASVCDEVARELNKQGPGQCLSLPADIQEIEQVKKLVSALNEKEPKGIDVLINNAGANWGEPIETYPDSAFDKILNLNVRRIFSLTQLCIPMLEKKSTFQDPSRIINIGSIDGIRIPSLETYAYSASKAAVHHMSRVLASHLGKRHITVNNVAPGPFPSKMMGATLEKFEDVIVRGIPLGRVGQPGDVAGACIYLSSKAGAYVSGTTIAVDGGALVASKL
ncbi:hypothetical protein H4R33_004551 [Dimargaris cristalligena]|uniref:Rhamnolipids biosynthesis 3-oxoacyl-reductase n=1 Tax=Dimargaris cristalligena TaxID=215637 RepID=A0A4Q0A1L2_9FUNG|nr:hypothetical protein H4R33_004551 [Dimargaris cristalligena]RKP39040.1 hypothetical protein BJ085DRAFT_35050 [Dimargaris cristalligena]|eukprot:RKP39040.1 hypothetical protein BJ085DRAFT_35050 [Dimargaris cristalligena]